MTALGYLEQIRDKYVDSYRSVLRAKRAEGVQCTPEIWVNPNIPPGQPKPPHPLCIDIMAGEPQAPAMVMVTGEPIEGALMGTMAARDVPVRVYAAVWESLPLWVRHPDPDWSALEPWQEKWMDVDRENDEDPDGLSGVVHYLGRPVVEGGGYFFTMDLGSAPVQAVTELCDALAAAGATEIELGRSDGSDLPPDVQAELQQPELSMPQLMAVLLRLLGALPEVANVQQISEEQISFLAKGDKNPHQMFLSNLHRLLQRTGMESRAREVNRFIRGQRELMVPMAVPELSQLRVVIKDNRFIDNIRQLGPKMKALVMENLAADLWMVCVWDSPNGMRFATEDEPDLYGLSEAQMLRGARENYLHDRPPVETSEHGVLLVARTGDCYDATLLIDDAWCQEMAEQVKGPLLACVPARNIVLIGGADRRDTFEEMCQAAARIEAGGDHLITNTILVRRDGKWEEYQPKVAPAPPPPQPPAAKKAWWRKWRK